MRKADIVIRHYDGHARPVVNVKIHSYRQQWEASGLIARVARDAGDRSGGFTWTWLDAHVNNEAQNFWYDRAIEHAWEQLQADVDAEHVFDHPAKVYGAGRSSGWAYINGFTVDSVLEWDAIAVARWATFCRFAREAADDVPYQYLSLIYLNVYEPWYWRDQTTRDLVQRVSGL